METTYQFSYPLNSENASPPGTFTVSLSWADMALPPKALTSAVTIAIVRMPLLFITGPSFVKLGGLEFCPDEACYGYLNRTRQDDGHAGGPVQSADQRLRSGTQWFASIGRRLTDRA